MVHCPHANTAPFRQKTGIDADDNISGFDGPTVVTGIIAVSGAGCGQRLFHAVQNVPGQGMKMQQPRSTRPMPRPDGRSTLWGFRYPVASTTATSRSKRSNSLVRKYRADFHLSGVIKLFSGIHCFPGYGGRKRNLYPPPSCYCSQRSRSWRPYLRTVLYRVGM